MNEDEIITKIVTASDFNRGRNADVEVDGFFIDEFENKVGFILPELLKKMYMEFGDGGFGFMYMESIGFYAGNSVAGGYLLDN